MRIEPGIECDTGDDDELVREIELIAVAAKGWPLPRANFARPEAAKNASNIRTRTQLS